jgi:hypothetical protein
MLPVFKLGTGTEMFVGQSFVNATLPSLRQAMASFVWTWKVQRSAKSIVPNADAWDVKFQSEIPNGMRINY